VISSGPLGLPVARAASAPATAPVRRGVRVRPLTQGAVLATPTGAACVATLHTAGVDIRVTPLGAACVLGVDTDAGSVAASGPHSVFGVHCLRNPVVLRLLEELFGQEWSTAGRPGAEPDAVAAEPNRLDFAVLDALASGAKDATTARQLGMSVRSLRRRVAELMTRLGAGSRFQAGVRAAERGWVTTRDEA
jgi:hypothetical protein